MHTANNKPATSKDNTVLSPDQAASRTLSTTRLGNTALSANQAAGWKASAMHVHAAAGSGVGRSVFSGGYTGNPSISVVAIDDQTVAIHGFDMREHILQLIKLKGAKSITMSDKILQGIINRHLADGDIFACQRELIDAGYESFAKL